MRSNEKYRVSHFTKDGKRISKMINERELQILRAHRLKEMRKNDLGLTQKDLVMALGVMCELFKIGNLEEVQCRDRWKIDE